MDRLDSIFRKIFTFMNRNGRMVRHQVSVDLEHLYPGGEGQEACVKFYSNKLKKSSLICFWGMLLGILLIGKSRYSEMELQTLVARGGALEKSKLIKLRGDYEGGNHVFELEIQPIQLTEEECELYYQDFCDHVFDLIRENNSSVQHIENDLRLLEAYDDYPFLIEWRSLNVDAISSSGVIKPKDVAQKAVLRATLSYMEFEKDMDVEITIAEHTAAEEPFDERLNNMLLQAERISRQQEKITLPEQLDGKEIRWSIQRDNIGYFVCIGAVVLGIAIFFMSDKDLHDEWEIRKKVMKKEYSDIVYKLALYMGAGMTIQGAFYKLSDRYEQILYACRELKSGIAESVVYENLGRRVGLPEYVKLGTLLSQNLKKGSNMLLNRLSEEANYALAEKIQIGRKLGEEASTKLLVPMVMMLAVVMIMVMFPAFSSMGM